MRLALHTSFKVKMSKVRVTRPINADTHISCAISSKWQGLRSYELQTWYTNGWRRPASVTGQRSRSYAHIVCTSHLCLFLIRETKCCTCVIRCGLGHTVSAEPGGYTSCLLFNDVSIQGSGMLAVPLLNKNLAIANRSRVNCAHNISRASMITQWPWNIG